MIAQNSPFTRVQFDPKNPAHIESFKVFVRTGNWGSIRFHAELPYSDVPATVMMKYAQYKLGVKRESEGERQVRFSVEKPALVKAFRSADTN